MAPEKYVLKEVTENIAISASHDAQLGSEVGTVFTIWNVFDCHGRKGKHGGLCTGS